MPGPGPGPGAGKASASSLPSGPLPALGGQSFTEGSAGAEGRSVCARARRLGRREGVFVPSMRVEVSSTEELCSGGLAVSNWS